MSSWYCIKTIANGEYKALRDLNHYYPDRVYLPEIKRDKRYRKKKKRHTKKVTEPMFPEYIFAQLNEDDDWSNVSKCGGFMYIKSEPIFVPLKVVKFGDFIPYIEDEFISKFKHINKALKTDYGEGDQIFIHSGTFHDNLAKIVKSGREAVDVLMGEILIRNVLKVDIEPISD